MVILGIDPGLANTGWGIIEERRGEVRCRAYGCIETSSGSDLAARLRRIADELTAVSTVITPSRRLLREYTSGPTSVPASPDRPCTRCRPRGLLALRG